MFAFEISGLFSGKGACFSVRASASLSEFYDIKSCTHCMPMF